MSFPLTWSDRGILISIPVSTLIVMGAYIDSGSDFSLFMLFFIVTINTGHFYLLLSLGHSRRMALEAATVAIDAQTQIIMEQNKIISKLKRGGV